MKEDRDFFEWYKQKITDNPQDPPADAWQNISDELDTNDVWDKVVARLDHRGGWFGQKPWSYAIPSLLLLFFSAGTYLYFHSRAGQTPSATVAAYADTESKPAHESLSSQSRPATADTPASSAEVSSATGPDSSANTDKGGDVASPYAGRARPLAERMREGTSTNVAPLTGPVAANKTFAAEDDAPARDDKTTTTANEAPATTATGPEGTSRRNGESDSEKVVNGQIAATATVSASQNTASDNDEEKQVIGENDTTDAANDLIHARRYESNAPPYANTRLRTMAMPDSMLSINPVVVAIRTDSSVTREAIPQQDLLHFSRTLEFGISGSAMNTWLLNQTTFRGLEKYTLTTTLPDFGKNLGAVLRYNFSRFFSAQAEGFFISDMGQRYNEYRKGKYIERNVDLTYIHANLLFKYGNNALMLGRPVNGHGVIGGLFFSKLRRATETIGDHTLDISDAYANTDYGLVLGYEYNQRLMPNLFFTSAVRMNYGLKDIRSHAGSKTVTGSFDVNLALRYRMGL